MKNKTNINRIIALTMTIIFIFGIGAQSYDGEDNSFEESCEQLNKEQGIDSINDDNIISNNNIDKESELSGSNNIADKNNNDLDDSFKHGIENNDDKMQLVQDDYSLEPDNASITSTVFNLSVINMSKDSGDGYHGFVALNVSSDIPATVTATAQNGTFNASPHTGFTGLTFTDLESGTDITAIIGENYTVNYTNRGGTAYNAPTPPTNAGNYTATITINPDQDYIGTGTVDFSITKAEGAAISGAPELSLNTALSITVHPVTSMDTTKNPNVQYAIHTTNNQDASALSWGTVRAWTGLIPNTTYYAYARTQESDNYNAGAMQVSVGITTDKPTLRNDVSIAGDTGFGETLIAVTTGLTSSPVIGSGSVEELGTIYYQWSRNDTPINGATNSTYTLVRPDVGQTITVTVTTENTIGSRTSAATATITCDHTYNATVNCMLCINCGFERDRQCSISNPCTFHTPISYSVAFNGNNSTSGTMPNQSFTYGTAQNLTANVFTRTGHTFLGWNTATDGTGTSYTNGQNVNNLTAIAGATITLYAQWTPITYSVTFDGNGSTGGSMSNQAFTYGTAQNLTANAFTRTGHVFDGWNTNVAGTGTSYTNTQSVNNLTIIQSATVTLYAQWHAISSEANITAIAGQSITWGGGNGSSATTPKTASINVAYSVTAITSTNVTVSKYATVIVTDGTLAVGANTVKIEVTAEDGTKLFYEVTVTRAELPSDPIVDPPKPGEPGWTPPNVPKAILDQTGTYTGSGNAVTRIDGLPENFVQLKLDGEIVNPSNYTVTAGSTIITKLEAFIKTLPVGTHVFRAEFTTGYAEFSLTISASNENNTQGNNSNNQSGLPKTGVDSNIMLLISLLMLSVMGAVTAFAMIKRIKSKKTR